jgi:hypothetical protein
MIKDSGERREWNGQLNHRGDKRGCTITHGGTGTRLYEIWCCMKKRCYNPKDKRFKNYGGRGITVCDEWKNDYLTFKLWATSNGYQDDLTIDRISVDGNYCPENCRWATAKEQMRNTTRNHFVTAFGETKTIAEWSENTGIHPDVIKDRLNKLHWTPEEAVSIKTLKIGGKRNVSNS